MEFCYKTASVWQLVGKGMFILKILVPIIIIVIGTIDLGKAAMASDDGKNLKLAGIKLLKRFILGVIIFFVPLIINIIFSMITLFSEEMKNDYDNCVKCLTTPFNDCDTSYEGNIFKK